MPRRLLLYFTLSLISISLYLLASTAFFRAGFPLDDAWIHQTYARSLARDGAWTFQQGVPSAGSTAPVWSALLSVGYLLRLPPLVWSSLLGVLTLAALAETARRGLRVLVPDRPGFALWAGVLVVFEWHLVWAALSGMETLLAGLLAAALLVDLAAGTRRPLLHGAWVGAALWLRPDGLTLLGPAIVVYVLADRKLRTKAADLGALTGGVLALALPYLAFNLALSGEIWPSTLFAKQAEYAVLRELPVLLRLWEQLQIPLVGLGVLLLPGFAWLSWRLLRTARWGALVGPVWALGMAVLYAWRLPVTYQHGRYLIPAIPVWLIWGLAGLALLLRPQSRQLWPRVLGRAWLGGLAVVAAGFYVLGLQAYSRDVAVIESEMVDTAAWVAANTPPDARIAAHDIGALGYFADREILDLAGLVTPEVIPIVRDEAALRVYLDREGAEYLVTLEGWYPELEAGLEVVFRTDASHSPALGGTNMVVYRWKNVP